MMYMICMHMRYIYIYDIHDIDLYIHVYISDIYKYIYIYDTHDIHDTHDIDDIFEIYDTYARMYTYIYI